MAPGGAEADRFTNGDRGGYLLGGPSSGELAADTPVGAVIGKGLQVAGKAAAPIARKIASAAKGQLDDAAGVVKNLFGGSKRAAAESAEQLAVKSLKPDPRVIRGIKALPDGAKLTDQQVSALGKNIDVILQRTVPAKGASGRIDDVIDLFKNDSRFRFLDQVPGGRARINEALGKFGASL